LKVHSHPGHPVETDEPDGGFAPSKSVYRTRVPRVQRLARAPHFEALLLHAKPLFVLFSH